MEEKFSIQVSKLNYYQFDVEIYHRSTQVVRFSLKRGQNEFKVEKRLLEKKQPWRLINSSFPFKDKNAWETLSQVFSLLEQKIKDPHQPYIHPKNRT